MAYRRSVEPRFGLRQQLSCQVMLLAVAAQRRQLLERRDRRAQVADLALENPGLVPESGLAGRDQQQALDPRARSRQLVVAQQPQLDVVLQPQQHLAVAGWLAMFR